MSKNVFFALVLTAGLALPSCSKDVIGYPPEEDNNDTTVIADDCATADAYATAFMVVGLDEAKRILDRHPDLLAYLIYTDSLGNYAVYDGLGQVISDK